MKNREETCEERVQSVANERLNHIRALLNPTVSDFYLIDDGTLDTVIGFGPTGEVLRVSDTAYYRNEPGELDLDALLDDYWGLLLDNAWEALKDYGLSFEWKPGDPKFSGFWAFVLSTGGPHEEIRFYGDASGTVYRTTFFLGDWGDGAELDITDRPAAQMLWEYFDSIGAFESTE